METKDIIGLLLISGAGLCSILTTCLSQRARDAAFFLMIAGIVVSDRLDINFFTHFWYRGTTRGLEVSFVDILALGVFVSSFLLPRREESRWVWPAGMGFLLLFLLYAFVSTLAGEPKVFGLFEFSKMLRGLLFVLAAVMFVRSQRELAIFVAALCAAVCLQGILAVRQRWLMHLERVAGSLDHSNSLSVYLLLVGPILVAALNSDFPKYLRWFASAALASAFLTIVLTISRAGVPFFCLVVLGATAFCASWRITFKKLAIIGVASLGVFALAYKFWDDLRARYEESTLQDEYLNEKLVENRGYYLRLARVIVEDRFFGVGLNNWSYWVSKRYGAEANTPFHYNSYEDLPPGLKNTDDNELSFAAPAHNLFALTVGELGIPGLALLLLLWLRWFQMGMIFLLKRNASPMRRIGIGIFFGFIGVFLQSMTEWSFRHTPVFLTFHAALGVLASLYAVRKHEIRAAREPDELEYWEMEAEPEPAMG